MKEIGVCISENEKKKLKNGNYKVFIDTELFNGNLNYGEFLLKEDPKKKFSYPHIFVIHLLLITKYQVQAYLRI